ncbi:hypothetical protein QYS36_15015 [Pseudomonas sp. G34]|uniref:hypothetical protein n=1 Tax=Pseudomonas sp. G34 TaxID=3059083 RepID=UPI002807878E|nr:hypothetical protein [Pseudomonas sp. G34]MDQ7986249.1 hypothetical protein [Pseudomonas sp. G34]
MTINILPLLKSAEWVRLAVGQNRLVSPLPVDGVEASSASPVIAYGVDQADNVAFLPATESNLQRIKTIRERSFAALRQRLAYLDWNHTDGGNRDVLIFAGDFNAAECLLLPERMQEAHTLLSSPELLACTPKRGVLLVCRYLRDNKDATEAFLGLCHEIYYEQDGEPISPIVWGVSQGLIKDQMQIGEAYLEYLKNKYSTEATQQKEVVTEASRDEQGHGRGADVTEAALLYSPGQIAFMTLFGTPLAGFYGIFRNYSRLGEISKARGTIVASCFVIPLMILSFLTLPGSAYDKMFPVFSAILLGGVCKLTQGRMLGDAQMKGARYHKVWNQCLVIFFTLLLMLLAISVCMVFVS